jgi:hypothetical protein
MGVKGGDWFKGAVNPRADGWGYQGVCWGCGKVGHKTNECRVRLQEVSEENKESAEDKGFVDESAL